MFSFNVLGMMFPFSFVNALLDEASKISQHYFLKTFEIERKQDNSPVTVADREIERVWREKIAQKYPMHDIWGEEYGRTNDGLEYCWLLDPIDGTRNFVTKSPLFGNLIALLKDGMAIAGAINLPMLNQRYLVGIEGLPLFGGKPLQNPYYKKIRLEDAFVGCSTVDMFDSPDRKKFLNLTQSVADRRYGGDCFNFCQLVQGGLNLVIEGNLKPYDYAPALALIERLGGQVTDWQGNPLSLSEGQHNLIASFDVNLHQKAVNALS